MFFQANQDIVVPFNTRYEGDTGAEIDRRVIGDSTPLYVDVIPYTFVAFGVGTTGAYCEYILLAIFFVVVDTVYTEYVVLPCIQFHVKYVDTGTSLRMR